MSIWCRRKRRALPLAATLVLLAALAVSASAELTQQGNLFIRFDGGIAPLSLPRDKPAPISVRIEGAVRALSGKHPPALREIQVMINRGGTINATGLPVCRRGQISTASASQALAACGPALVGSGGIVARTTLPDQTPAPVRAEILLFNASDHGHIAVLGYIYETQPAPLARVMTFRVQRRDHGAFGTVITGKLPASFNRNGYIKSIFLQLERRYTFRGQHHSYITAACAAPPGFMSASFPFARTSMVFADGRRLTNTLVRTCRVSN